MADDSADAELVPGSVWSGRALKLALLLQASFLWDETEAASNYLLATAAVWAAVGLLAALTRRPFASLLGTAFLTLVLRAFGTFTHTELETPVVAADLFRIGTVLGDPTALRQYAHLVVGAACITVPMGVVLLWSAIREPGWWLGTQAKAGLGLTALCLGVLTLGIAPWSPLSQAASPSDRFNMPAFFWAERSHVSTLLRSIPYARATAPGGTVPASRLGPPSTVALVGTPPATLPDVMVVLHESTFDPADTEGCEGPACHVPLFDADARTIERGYLEVHTRGGGTWLSEFTLSSGFSWTDFGLAGFFVQDQVAPRLRHTLAGSFAALGYRTVVVYPVESDFAKAGEAYRGYAFEEFHPAEELKLPDDWSQRTDKLLYGHALERFAAADARPTFLLMLTIKNHGPHGQKPDAVPEALRLHVPDERLSVGFGDYLGRLQESSDDAAWFEERYFAPGAARPRLLVHFGDHLPSFDGTAKRLVRHFRDIDPPGEAQHYLTYFHVKGSPELPGARHADPLGRLDLAFLGRHTLEWAGLPLDPFHQANRQLEEACHGRYRSCEERDLIGAYLTRTVRDLGAFQ